MKGTELKYFCVNGQTKSLRLPMKKEILTDFGQARYDLGIKIIMNNMASNVLDLGCNYGEGLRRMKDSTPIDKAVGFDNGLVMDVEGDIELYEHDIQQPYPTNERFDVITMFETIEHLQHPKKALELAIDALNEGGKLIISTPYKRFQLFKNKEHINELSPSMLMKMLRQHKDKISSVKWYGQGRSFLHFPGQRLLWKLFGTMPDPTIYEWNYKKKPYIQILVVTK